MFSVYLHFNHNFHPTFQQELLKYTRDKGLMFLKPWRPHPFLHFLGHFWWRHCSRKNRRAQETEVHCRFLSSPLLCTLSPSWTATGLSSVNSRSLPDWESVNFWTFVSCSSFFDKLLVKSTSFCNLHPSDPAPPADASAEPQPTTSSSSVCSGHSDHSTIWVFPFVAGQPVPAPSPVSPLFSSTRCCWTGSSHPAAALPPCLFYVQIMRRH